jgi:hypothetical protein
MQSEQQFYDNHSVNTDPREQPQQQVYGEHSYAGAKLDPRQYRPRRRTPWFLVLILLLILILAGGSFAAHTAILSSYQGAIPTRTFTGVNQLVVDDTSGDINIHPGDTSSIIVSGTKYVYGLGAGPNDLQVQYDQSGNTLTVKAENGFSLFEGDRGINLDITVPRTLGLTVQEVSGNVAVQDITGPVSLETVSGDIKANELNGQISLTTTSGNIRASDINGQTALSSTSGDIEVDHAQLHGQTTLDNTSGNISVTGSLDPNGSYHMDDTSGDIQLTLPANSSFQLATSTTSGDIHNDFGSQVVGNAPHATLSLDTTSGNISVRRQ